MNKTDAKKIAETITNEQIKAMFDAAKVGITDWTKVSTCNKGHSKGCAWNILARKFNVNEKHHPMAKRNFIWEFGDFLPESLKARKKPKKTYPHTHHDPIFD